jgi:hypothetical protein
MTLSLSLSLLFSRAYSSFFTRTHSHSRPKIRPFGRNKLAAQKKKKEQKLWPVPGRPGSSSRVNDPTVNLKSSSSESSRSSRGG